MPTIPDHYSTHEAAAALGLSHSAIKDALHRGALTAVQVAHRNFITTSELERYRAQHLGGRGWAARKAADYRPNEHQAGRQRAYRQRKKGHSRGEESRGG